MTAASKLDNSREIELAEGVHIYLRPVGIFPRLAARFIDALIWGTVYFVVIVIVMIPSNIFGVEVSLGLSQLLAFGMFWFYDPLFEASKWSATPGKCCLGLKVVRRSGAPVGFASAFLRGLLFWIDVLPGVGAVGTISILASRHSQRLGDRVADTLVVYRQPSVVPTLADISVPAISPGVALSREEQLAFISFADRFAQLSPSRQQEVSLPLASLPSAQKSPHSASFALGVARWLSKNEQ